MERVDHTGELEALARRYIWWKSATEAMSTPDRIIAQVMNIGDFDDMQALARQVGDDVLRRVLTNAEAGQFNARSWTYWHYRLDLAHLGQVPPMPVRKVE
ncbi:MAG: hypothetical protein ACREX6_03545 [Casimicrobiaceae bacterium]